MALVFPTSPVEGRAYSGFRYVNGVWKKSPTGMALPKNYIVNPAMQHSQQNARAGASTNAYYLADQWAGQFSGATTYAFASLASGRLWLSVSASGTAAAADYTGFTQKVEGQRIADLRWGTADAVPAVLRFTALVNIEPAGGNRAIAVTIRGPSPYPVISFTVTVTTVETVFTVAIPPPTTGTFPISNLTGFEVWFVFVGGTSHRVNTSGVWTTGGAIGTTTMSSGALGDGSSLTVGDVGFYADPYATAAAPPFETPDYTAELRACQRYWCKVMGLKGGASSATNAARIGTTLPVQMRAIPAMTAVGSPGIYDGTVTPVLAGAATSNLSSLQAAEANWTTAGLVAGRAVSNYYKTDADYFAMNARL